MVCEAWKGCALVTGNEQDGWFVEEGGHVSRGAVAGVRENACQVGGPCPAAVVAEPGVECPAHSATLPIQPPPYTCVVRAGRCEEVPEVPPRPAPPLLPVGPDHDAVRGVVVAASAQCVSPGARLARGRVVLTVAPSGRVARVEVRPPLAGTPAGACLEAALRAARIPPFSGSEVMVGADIGAR